MRTQVSASGTAGHRIGGQRTDRPQQFAVGRLGVFDVEPDDLPLLVEHENPGQGGRPDLGKGGPLGVE